MTCLPQWQGGRRSRRYWQRWPCSRPPPAPDGGADKGSAGANPTLATDPPRTNPTLATVPAPTTTTNPYAVPAVIDAAYVNRVLAGLDARGRRYRPPRHSD